MLTRRQLLGAGLAQAQRRSVIVCGAGLAGLAAAIELVEGGFAVTVYCKKVPAPELRRIDAVVEVLIATISGRPSPVRSPATRKLGKMLNTVDVEAAGENPPEGCPYRTYRVDDSALTRSGRASPFTSTTKNGSSSWSR